MHFARSVKVYMICMSQQLGSEIERQGKSSQLHPGQLFLEEELPWVRL